MKRAMAFNIVVISLISLTVLLVLVLVFNEKMGKDSRTTDNIYKAEMGKARLVKAKAKCELYCKEGNPKFFEELTELKGYQAVLGLSGLHCYDIVDITKCNGELSKIKSEVDNYYES